MWKQSQSIHTSAKQDVANEKLNFAVAPEGLMALFGRSGEKEGRKLLVG